MSQSKTSVVAAPADKTSITIELTPFAHATLEQIRVADRHKSIEEVIMNCLALEAVSFYEAPGRERMVRVGFGLLKK